MVNKRKLRILFLCTGNSCRSQMAEGFARHLRSDKIDVHSAGIEPKGVDPRAVKAMAEIGIDISNQTSKSPEEIDQREFDCVITLCDNAHKSCPSFPGKTRVIHVGFEDPPRLAAGMLDEEKAMEHYRRVRDQIRAFVAGLPESLPEEDGDYALSGQQQFQTGIQTFLNQLPEGVLNKKEE